MNMNIKMILAGLALFGFTAVSAQENLISAGLEVGLPLGNFGNATSFGIGGSLGFELPVADNIGAVVQAGFMSFSGKDQSYGLVTVEGGNWTMIPIQVGAKYYFTNDQEGFYAMGLVGIHSMSYKIPGYTTTLFGVRHHTRAKVLGYEFELCTCDRICRRGEYRCGVAPSDHLRDRWEFLLSRHPSGVHVRPLMTAGCGIERWGNPPFSLVDRAPARSSQFSPS
ncbi:MAG: hypothetical protein IPF64_16090 [Flavobacteriales bacterium]|nr:hypothetical protein [Flavobacteriales bacterium]